MAEAASASALSWISLFHSLQRKELQKIWQLVAKFSLSRFVAGVTGTKIAETELVRSKAKQIKTYIDIADCSGFGIRSIEDTAPYQKVCDRCIYSGYKDYRSHS